MKGSISLTLGQNVLDDSNRGHLSQNNITFVDRLVKA